MACHCGSDLVSRSAKRTADRAHLDFQECRQCGRIGLEALFLRGEAVMFGTTARYWFNTLTPDKAQMLWRQHVAKKTGEDAERSERDQYDLFEFVPQ